MAKTLVQEQFGKTAASYLTSTPHAKGKSLERLIDLVQPKKDWRVLDVATGGGHVAYIFAPHVARVWATDITDEMLDVVRSEAAKRSLDNVRTAYAKAEALPFDDASFDAAISIWTHTDIDDFAAAVTAVARVLRPGAPLVYIGAHPCFVGPHSLYVSAEGVPELSAGYRRTGRYDGSAFGVGNPDGVRIRVGGVHLTLGALFDAFTSAGFVVERFEELARERDYPHALALRARAAT